MTMTKYMYICCHKQVNPSETTSRPVAKTIPTDHIRRKMLLERCRSAGAKCRNSKVRFRQTALTKMNFSSLALCFSVFSSMRRWHPFSAISAVCIYIYVRHHSARVNIDVLEINIRCWWACSPSRHRPLRHGSVIKSFVSISYRMPQQRYAVCSVGIELV